MRCLAIMMAALALASCAGEQVPVVKWSKPGATYDQFLRDRAACIKEQRGSAGAFYVGGMRYTGGGPALNPDRFIPCMGARGYVRDPKGYAAPPGEEIPVGS